MRPSSAKPSTMFHLSPAASRCSERLEAILPSMLRRMMLAPSPVEMENMTTSNADSSS